MSHSSLVFLPLIYSNFIFEAYVHDKILKGVAGFDLTFLSLIVELRVAAVAGCMKLYYFPAIRQHLLQIGSH
jgi:hypothetical protein